MGASSGYPRAGPLTHTHTCILVPLNSGSHVGFPRHPYPNLKRARTQRPKESHTQESSPAHPGLHTHTHISQTHTAPQPPWRGAETHTPPQLHILQAHIILTVTPMSLVTNHLCPEQRDP